LGVADLRCAGRFDFWFSGRRVRLLLARQGGTGVLASLFHTSCEFAIGEMGWLGDDG
jgi:hypothetical protein